VVNTIEEIAAAVAIADPNPIDFFIAPIEAEDRDLRATDAKALRNPANRLNIDDLKSDQDCMQFANPSVTGKRGRGCATLNTLLHKILMRRYLSAAAAAEQKSINTRFTVRLFPVAVGKINGLERISRHLPKDQFVWISKTLRVAEDDAKNMQDSQVKASKFVIWMHDKAAQGNTMIQDFADSTVDKSKVAAWK
jgi:hypothetical protein